MRKLIIVALVVAGGVLTGCAGVVTPAVEAARGLTDRALARAGDAADAIMDTFDEIEGVLEAEIERVRAARCLLPLPAIRRYAGRSETRRNTIARDCLFFISYSASIGPPFARRGDDQAGAGQ